MIFDCKLEVFLGLDCSQDEAFVCLNYHKMWFLIDKDDNSAHRLDRKSVVCTIDNSAL